MSNSAETLFESDLWFRLWLDAFGSAESGRWRASSQAAPPVEIPYLIENRQVGPFRLRIAAAAANSHSPRFDVCGSGSLTAADLRNMMRDLQVAALVFPFVSESSRLGRAIGQEDRMLSSHRDFCEASPYVDCTGNWDQYLKSRGKTRRNTWLYYERRAQKNQCTFDNLTDWQDILKMFDQILAVEASGWKGKAGTSIVQNLAIREFYTRLCEELARSGRLRVFLLRKDERILAFQLCTLYGGTLSCLKIGYLEEYASESPGQVLQLQIVRWAFSEPSVRIFDMLGPASETKLKWATDVERLFTYYIFHSSLAGTIAKLRWKTGPNVKEFLGKRGIKRSTKIQSASSNDDNVRAI